MAVRKTRNFLPTVFQTDTNEKFLSATMDQLVSEPVLTTLYGYIGRKFAPTFKTGDSYITESTASRQDYQLEASTVVRDDSNNVTFFSNYIDYLNKLNYYGAITNNQNRLFNAEYYTFDPLISFDKFVNFSQYYWLPDGPDVVEVDTSGIELIRTYNVKRDVATQQYIYSVDGVVDNSIILPRGGTYRFIVDQPGYPFWIQTELGTDGMLNATPTISSRDVLGVENNGTDSGVITFNIPQIGAQDRFTTMPTIASVDYANPLAYSDLQNTTLSRFLSNYPQYAGITGQLNGKLLVFVSQETLNNRGDEIWITPNVVIANTTIVSGGTVGSSNVRLASGTNISANLLVSGAGIAANTTVISVSGADITLSSALTANAAGIYTFTSTGYDAGALVPYDLRYDVWRVQFIDIGLGDPLIKLVHYQDVAIDQKVYIRYGIGNANKEFYKDYDGFFKQVPLLSSLATTLFAQDGVASAINTTFKIVEYNNWNIDVETDILGKQNYTSPNGIEFTSGLKIQFSSDVLPETYRNRQYYVESVGDLGGGIQLVPVDELVRPELYNDENALNYPDQVFPEYITINRVSVDRNPWSRNNRWFHRDVITVTAEYRNETPIFSQDKRAQRPIVQFEGDILLFNNGRIAKLPIDILDTTTLDAFNDYEGQVLSTAFGITLTDGIRVVFAADQDPLVRNKIYVVNLVQYTVNSLGIPDGPKYINLVKADDGDIETHDTTVVKQGQYKGSQWWYDGTQWLESQQKTSEQQEPLFEIYNSTFDPNTGTVDSGRSLSQLTRSTFAGTKLFGYLRSTAGVDDSVLGFPLSYRNFTSQGDIEFQNYFTTDTYNYVVDGEIITENISTGFLQKIRSRYVLQSRNTWTTVVEPTRQYQIIGYIYDGISNLFPVDVTPNTQGSIPYLKVFKNYQYLTNDQWVFVANQVRLTTSETFIGDGTTTEFRLTTVSSTENGVIVLVNGIARLAAGYYGVTGLVITFVTAPTVGDEIDIRVIVNPVVGDKIDILIFSDEVSELGYYQVPLNLDLNAQNIDVDVLTLGQVRNHLIELGQNSTTLIGDVIGISNLRDVDIKQQGGTILQHSAPVPYGELFLIDNQANFIDGIRYAQREYTRFKNKFFELSGSLIGIQPTDPVGSVDLILTEINKFKNPTFPWFYSDMIPYGTLKSTINYTVFNPLDKDYEITNIFSDTTLSNRAVLVYLNGGQLIKDLNYTFRTDRPAVTILDDLAVDDIITFVEYQNTDGCYVPETPSKLGLWPKFKPELFFDNTYRTPINVIRGHDGSITPAFGDYRDDFLLELELRIYNNIKLPNTGTYGDIFQVIPGKFRDSEYTLSEITQLVSKNFQSWVGNNKLDFSTNETFQSNDLFTWNYGGWNDRIDGEELPGSWRACYQYFYDTVYPHLFPWEMLGFSVKPDWWETYYGPAPYTSGNQLLWQDLEAGRIRYGARAGIDSNYARPGLTTIVPVDENGNLIPPASLITASYNATRAASAWAVGQYGPVEYAWRTSSDFPFAVQQAAALAKPGIYFGLYIDTYNYSPFNAVIQPLANADYITQYLTFTTKRHITQDDVYFNGQSTSSGVYRTAGYLNWIADYLISQGVNPANKIPMMLKNYQVNLAYKTAGFTDQTYLNVLAEQVSPSSTNDTIVIPNENYKVYLNKSTPTQKLVYSAVIVEKTTNGYSIRGYDLNNPFFTIIPSVVNTSATKITVLNSSATIFRDYQNLKLIVPYGYEFTSQQQIVDFLISYERYLIAQGFVFQDFDEALGEMKDWKLSSREFLYWAQQGWQPGSILVLSPVANVLKSISIGAIADGISDSQYGSRVIDQNFKLIKNIDYEVLRSPTNFKVTLTNSASVIGYVEIDLVQYEHVLIFDNTTVFNDIIYKPETGNRQFRLKLVGQKTAEWDGSLYAPGFVYNSGQVDNWSPGVDYLFGDLVIYKDQYYTALQNVIASTEFQFVYWAQLSNNQIQTQSGLLPNFSLLAAESKAYYDSYPSVDDKKQIEYSHGLIGYRPRQYLDDLGLTETTQIEFYKGYIKQKGSLNAINQLIKAQFNNLTSNISLYEEWALRVGTYGALDVNPYVEIALDEKAYGVNPSLARFVGAEDTNIGNGETIFNKQQLYKSTDQFNGNIALNRTADSDYDNDILTAGYVNIDDIDATIFDLADYVDLDDILGVIGTGYLIWCARDFTQNWNVYRVTETNNHVNTVAKPSGLDNYVTFTFDTPHGLAVDEVFLIRDFLDDYDGFYQVYRIDTINKVTVKYNGSTSNLTTLTGDGLFFVLDSMRFRYMEDSRVYGQPPNGWKVGDKIWIDIDAETSAVQGQPFGTQPSNTWKVYEKTKPWGLKQSLNKGSTEYLNNSGYGTSVKMSADGQLVVTGTPYSGNGVVNTFFKNYNDEYLEGFSLRPLSANTMSFGYTVDLSADEFNAAKLAVGAPGSYGNVGFVSVYSKSVNSTAFTPTQILVGNVSAANADTFGSSLAFNQNGNWLYVGAPGNDTVYIYGLNRFIPRRQQTISVNNLNTITVANAAEIADSISVSIDDVLYIPATAATVIVNEASSGNTITVNSLTNIIPQPGDTRVLANIALDNNITANSGSYITQISSSANIQVSRSVSNDSRVYGRYVNTNRFDTSGNISVNGTEVVVSTFAANAWSNVGVKPTQVGFANIFKNGVDTGLHVISTTSTPVISNISIGFTPIVTDDANSLLVYSGSKVYIPNIEYTVDSANLKINFAAAISQSDITVVQQPYYALLTTKTGNAGSNFGYALSSSFDGAQLAVGAPLDNVLGFPGAGSVLVFDRVIEAFNSTGTSDYVTQNPILAVYRVTIDNIEVDDYLVIGANTIRFTTPPPVGRVVYIETNAFTLLEKIVGVDSLEGGTGAIQANAFFGTSLTICSNNCAIYIGAPNYNNGTEYNTGAVWKFHNKGRLYGTNRGFKTNPVFTPGDTLRLDNFEVAVQGRLMPAAVGNILSLNSNITVTAGNYITQTGSTANLTVLANVTNGRTVTVSGNWSDLNYGYGNIIAVNGANVTAYPMASLDSFIKDINDRNLLGISATNENGRLRLNSDSTVAKNLLRVLAGTTQPNSIGVLAAADMIVFAFMQIIINPYGAAGEYFGNKVKLAANAYMLVIGSARGTTRRFATFDTYSLLLYPNAAAYNTDGSVNTLQYQLNPKSPLNNNPTTFDNTATRWVDQIVGSGSVYIYELYDDPRPNVEDPGRYAFAQQLDPDTLNVGDQFGYALDIEGTYITISAPSDDTTITDGGSVYVFENPNMTRGWNLIRYQQPTVDVDSLTRCFLYSSLTNTILDNLQFIDPAKGRILGQAEQEITYKTEFDPAVYNRGTNPNADISSNVYWTDNQVGQVWWNLSKVRFIDYEQDTLTYRSINWGALFPGSVVEVCEWVESTVLPNQYVANGGIGVPKYADNSAYVEIVFVDPITNIIGSKYYYWVKDKTSVDPNNKTRNLPISSVADLIANPKNQGISYAAVIRNDAVILYNISQYLSAQTTILHLDYQLLLETNTIHSEYELVQKGNPSNYIPNNIIDKLIDSLSGINSQGAVVPDPGLSVAESYGIEVRPRQSMFIDRLSAVLEMVDYVNSILIQKPIARQYDLNQLNSAEPEPSLKYGEYDLRITTEVELAYIDVTELPVGYKILAAQDTTQDNLWVLYELDDNKTWQIIRVQSYKTNLYWDYIDWYAPGFEPTEVIEYVVDTLVDALKLPVAVGDEVLVKVSNATGGGFNILTVLDDGTYQVVGIENGTIQLKTSLGNFADNELGFGNQGYSTNRYDQNPNIEIRNIVQALQNNIFINELQGEFNNLFFVLVNYLLSEQKYVDWIFKTSFMSVTHNLRTLSQFPSYIRDNQTYYQNYIEEVKPYRTKLREYLIDYIGDDEYPSTVTDFDLPPYYDQTLKIFRSPSGEYISTDTAIWQTYPYNQWYNNRKLQVDSVIIGNAGLGYIVPPTVTIIAGSGGGAGATATATIDGDTGAVTSITVTNTGSGYITTPTVIVNGSATVPATAYAVLRTNQVRTFDTTLKFDRISYTSIVTEWTANTAYYKTVFDANGHVVSGNVISHVDADGIRTAYSVNANLVTGNTFVNTNFTVFKANAFTNANDRILGYYEPTSAMPARDLNQLIYGIEYPGVQVQGPNFNQQPGFSGPTTANVTLSSAGNVAISVGNIIVQGNGSMTVTTVYSGTKVRGVINAVGFNTNSANIGIIENGHDVWPPGNVMASSSYITDIVYFYTGGLPFGSGGFDNVDYDADGNPILSESVIDSIIQSTYLDSALGTRPEDIDVDGGAYVDRYSSHAPEEMIPGSTFDTLDMRVFTQYDSDIYGYRIFNNMLRQTSYLRISDNATTELANALSMSDSTILVINANALPRPDTTTAYPGVVFIGAERITYWRNYSKDVTVWNSTTAYANTSVLQYGNVITFNGNVNVNVNNYILQPNSNANARVTALGVYANSIYVAYTDANVFTLGSGNISVTGQGFAELQMNSAFSANVGNYITQISSNANLTVLSNVSAGSNVYVSYSGAFIANVGFGNIKVNGANVAVYPIIANLNSAIPQAVYPITSDVAYFTTTNVIPASTIFDTANVAILPNINTLAQIRRGTQGTSIANSYPVGSLVVDAGHQQVVPLVTNKTVRFIQLELNANISVSIGANITQPETGAIFRALSTVSNVSSIAVSYSGPSKLVLASPTLLPSTVTLAVDGVLTSNLTAYPTGPIYPIAINSAVTFTETVTADPSYVVQFSNAISVTVGANIITANVGDTITQATTGTNATILGFKNVAGNILILAYNNANRFNFLLGNVVAISNVALNGTYTGNVYPISSNLAGYVGMTDNGNVTVNATEIATIKSDTLLQQSNIWLNLGANIATDGTGLLGAGTVPALFIKSELAILSATSIKPDILVTEDAINTLTTEDGNEIIEEYE